MHYKLTKHLSNNFISFPVYHPSVRYTLYGCVIKENMYLLEVNDGLQELSVSNSLHASVDDLERLALVLARHDRH